MTVRTGVHGIGDCSGGAFDAVADGVQAHGELGTGSRVVRQRHGAGEERRVRLAALLFAAR